jgi:hypothetical protein
VILNDVNNNRNNVVEKEEDLDETTKKYGFEVGMFKAITSKDKSGELKSMGGK